MGYTVQAPSGTSNGLPLLIHATATLGDTIHTAISGTSSWDELTIFAWNNDTSDHNLTVEFGGASYPITLAVAKGAGVTIVVAGFRIQNGLLVTAFSDTADKVFVKCEVNRAS